MSAAEELGPKAIERLEADLAGLREANQRRLQELAARGLQVNLLAQLVDAMIETLFPVGSVERVRFLRSWEEKASGILDEIEADLRRQVLLQGAPNGHRG